MLAVDLPRFSFSSATDLPADHHEFGRQLGARFAPTIQERFALKSGLRQLLAVANSSAGAALYDEFVETHDRMAPNSMAELRGLAAGSGVPFNAVFLQNIPLEYTSCAQQRHLIVASDEGVWPSDDHCSDYSLCDADGACAVAHNEDNAEEDLGRTALVSGQFGAAPPFTAYTYLGELPSGAFGFNPHVAFTLNWLGPTDVACPGLGRGFISRSLLTAATLDEAVAVAADARQSAGHNYQLMDLSARAVLNLEAAPRGVYAVTPVAAPAYFHANQYVTLAVPQSISNSSVHRMARAAEMPSPVSADDMLHALGDQEDHDYPIFHDNASHAHGDKSGWTIATALFDLDRARLSVYTGNPREGLVLADLPLTGARVHD